eukprot:TRINITY_DN34712_c0_g1_i1.p1 TRINITY_DN34712_c0_g1~~TRINITY_DN34712_c0_g1_i1.p1  ORF type:complete len:211 (+),score=19.62 TRINITY_DN34712_c0_g1_i1:80-712(+)
MSSEMEISATNGYAPDETLHLFPAVSLVETDLAFWPKGGDTSARRPRVSMTERLRAIEENMARNRSMMEEHQEFMNTYSKASSSAGSTLGAAGQMQVAPVTIETAPDAERERRQRVLFGGPGGAPTAVSSMSPHLAGKKRTFGCGGKAIMTPRFVEPPSIPFAGSASGFYSPRLRGGTVATRMQNVAGNAIRNAEALHIHRSHLSHCQPA